MSNKLECSREKSCIGCPSITKKEKETFLLYHPSKTYPNCPLARLSAQIEKGTISSLPEVKRVVDDTEDMRIEGFGGTEEEVAKTTMEGAHLKVGCRAAQINKGIEMYPGVLYVWQLGPESLEYLQQLREEVRRGPRKITHHTEDPKISPFRRRGV